MRVLHVITGLEAGGAEQWLRLLLRHSRADAEVVALTKPGLLAGALAADGVQVTSLDMRGNRDLTALPGLVRLIRRGRFDVVHTHLFRAQVYGALAARLAGVRAIVSTEHSLNARLIEGRPTDRPGVRALYLAAARLTRVIIAVSPPVARRLTEWGVNPSRVTVVPVGLDAAEFAFDSSARMSARAELGLAEDTVLLGGVGRLVEPKRFNLLLRAAVELPQVAVLLVGDGAARPALTEQAAELGMSGRVHFVGQRLDVSRWLSAMDVFVSPSPEETFGVAILEALAAGLPVVYAAGPALAAIPASVRQQATLITPTVESLRSALCGRLHDPRSPAQPAAFAGYDGAAQASAIDGIHQRCVSSASRGRARAWLGRRRRDG